MPGLVGRYISAYVQLSAQSWPKAAFGLSVGEALRRVLWGPWTVHGSQQVEF